MPLWELVLQLLFGIPSFVFVNFAFIYGWHRDRRKIGTAFFDTINEIISKLGPKDFYVAEMDIFITICIVKLFMFVPQIDTTSDDVLTIFAYLKVPRIYLEPVICDFAALIGVALLFFTTPVLNEKEWDIKLKFTVLDEPSSKDHNEYTSHETYKRSAKWRGRVAQLIGDTYQCLFLKRTYLKAVRNSLFSNFRLASEMDDAGKFDDVCISWKPSNVLKWALVQIKHRNTAEGSRGAIVTSNDLFHVEGNRQQDFYVIKYVSSIIDIEDNEAMKGSKMYVLATNAQLDKATQQESFTEADLSDELKELIPNHKGCWKLKRERFQEILENALDEKRQKLASAIKHIFRDELNDEDRTILKKYTAALQRDVLVYRNKEYKFTKKFAQSQSKRTEDEQLLWNMLFVGENRLEGTVSTKKVNSEEISAKKSSKTLPQRYNEKQIDLLVENFIFAFEQPDTDGLKQEIVTQLKEYNPMSGADAENYNKNLVKSLFKLILVSLCDNPRFLTEFQLLKLFEREQIQFTRAQHKSTKSYIEEMQSCRLQFKKSGLEEALLDSNLILLKSSTEDGFLTKLKLFAMLQNKLFFVFLTSDLRHTEKFSTFWKCFRGSPQGVTFLVIHDTYDEVLKSFSKCMIENKQQFKLQNKKLILLTNTKPIFEELRDFDEYIEDFDSDHDNCFLLVPIMNNRDPDDNFIFGNDSGIILSIIKSLDNEEKCVSLIEKHLTPYKLDKFVTKFLLDNFPLRHWLSSYYETLPEVDFFMARSCSGNCCRYFW